MLGFELVLSLWLLVAKNANIEQLLIFLENL
jgi:hypothetical protein